MQKDKASNNDIIALMIAALNDHFGVVEYLLEDGVDLAKATTNGEAALHMAAQEGHAEVLSILMAYGASLTARTADGRLPIDVAANDAISVLIHGPRPQVSHHPKPRC